MPLVLSHDKGRAGHKDPEAIWPTKSKMFHRPLMKRIRITHSLSPKDLASCLAVLTIVEALTAVVQLWYQCH